SGRPARRARANRFLRNPTIREPNESETAIELPWRVVLSPTPQAAWAHSFEPVTHDGRTELWHTRLSVNKQRVADEQDAFRRTLRAVWSLDPLFNFNLKSHIQPPEPETPIPFRTSLTERDRYEIVRATSDYNVSNSPAPLAVNHLMLSALGGWLDLRGA